MMAAWLKRGVEQEEVSKDTPLDALRYVILDTELTSLDHRTNRLLSIGAIAMQGASIRLGEQFYRVVNPDVTIPAEGIVIHKLRSEDVRDADEVGKTLEDLAPFLAGGVLVGHFVEIELQILRKEMARTGHKLENPAICTARAHQWILRQGPYSDDLAVQLEMLDLPTLARFYNLDSYDAHHALSDAFMTARIWQKMLHALQGKGVGDLRKLLKIAGK